MAFAPLACNSFEKQAPVYEVLVAVFEGVYERLHGNTFALQSCPE